MKIASSPPILRKFFSRRALQWSFISFGATVLLILPCLLYAVKVASERQLMTVARSAANVYRPLILEGNVRDAELQMPKALDLHSGESAIVRDVALHPIYPMVDQDQTPHCDASNRFCWSRDFRSVSLLYPIFFDEDARKLFGYLEITLKPILDWEILSILIAVAFAVFVIQALGLASTLRRCADAVTSPVAEWSARLTEPSRPGASELAPAPFQEFLPMHGAISALHEEIHRLQLKTAQETKVSVQKSILREIGHDLMTPLSQLKKFHLLHFERARTKGQLDEIEVARIDRTLKRATDLVGQLKKTYREDRLENESAPCLIGEETQVILSDLAHDSEMVRKGIRLQSEVTSHLPVAALSQADFYQILSNLVRNAEQALPDSGGDITVSLSECDGHPVLSVKDNGPGIPEAIQERIFDFDFTTKPGKGTGLGLGIVRRICQESGANIQFTSTPGKGVEFVVTFKSFPANPIKTVRLSV